MQQAALSKAILGNMLHKHANVRAATIQVSSSVNGRRSPWSSSSIIVALNGHLPQ